MHQNNSSLPVIAHIIYRLDVGGLENGLVNLINNMPEAKYKHVIICLTEYTDFRKRIKRADVDVYALHKTSGMDFAVYVKLWKLLKKIRPDIVHTRNMGTIDCVLVAKLAGIKYRVHSEHGREGRDSDGRYKRYNRMRRIIAVFIGCYIALSKDLEHWLATVVKIPRQKITQIYNGVDDIRFSPNPNAKVSEIQKWRECDNAIVIGTVGRMAEIKDQVTMASAFTDIYNRFKDSETRVYMVMIGDGILRKRIETILYEAKLQDCAWLPGDRSDIPDILNSLDIFILPSLNEGISNTILEAMSCGLPIIATNVGGNPELVVDNVNGILVPAGNSGKMADAIERYISAPELIEQHGDSSRELVEKQFALSSMTKAYTKVYDNSLSVM